ncbi:type IV secretory system conjugative DNA transfer family protein [Actinomyces sp.]|uniref:type IV secretory system conjugative DNA transfer family protein n=1 Tax=Actinomyces sp. TaxID=29317 RepID=UPI0026DD3F00|nr:TraM recognition domain-containing protein [Actinomyces sp.]MDO4899449.1 TraM recognition domain-containing protein [Actinomyces sp.]
MRGDQDASTYLLLGLIGTGVGLGATARLAAGAACTLGVCTVQASAPTGLVRVLTGQVPAEAWQAAGMPSWLFWACWAAELVAVIAVVLWASSRWGGRRQRRQVDPRRQAGMATAAQVRRHLSARAVERMRWLRPDLARPRAKDLGMRVGMARGVWVWIPIEDSVVISAPSRAGKGRYFVDPMVVEYPGAVVTTSVRAETALGTVLDRAQVGPVAVFAPAGIDAVGQAGDVLRRASIRWSLWRGCEDTETAMRRARALAANGGTRGTGNDEFWGGNARMVIAPLLHAAALGEVDVDALARWASRPGLAQEAVSILAGHPQAAPGWADQLASAMTGDDRTVANIWATVRTCISEPLMDPAVREAISPAPGEQLDIADFVRRRGTLYIVGDAAATSAPLVAALIEDVYAAAMAMANKSAGNRLTPPLGLLLDEINNIAVLPSLGTMMSAGGGSNVTTVIVEQSRAQAAVRLGKDAADALFDSATSKLILGGATRSETLAEITAAVGERDVRRRTVSTGHSAWGTSTSWAEAEERIMTGAQLRELPKGTALLLKGSAPAVIVEGRDLESRARRRGGRQSVTEQAPARMAFRGATVNESEE